MRPDGSTVLRSPEALGAYDRCIGAWLERWARESPDALAFAERAAAGGWRRVTWREARGLVGALAQGLLDLDLPREKPVAVISDNSVDHVLLMLAAMHVGRPICSVSTAYSRLTKDHAKIKSILDALDPALIFASDVSTYGAAIRAARGSACVVLGSGADDMPGAVALHELLAVRETGAVMRAFETIEPDAHAKYLLTSGSTGNPKVVINTHRMLCANQQMMAQVWRFLETEKPILVDWLPWSHTFGGNHDLNLVLRHGGTLYVDEGRPAPGLIDATVRNLREVRPNLLFNVPRGLDMMLPALEADLALARDVFSALRMVFYAGAALPSSTWSRLQTLAAKVRDEPLWMTTSWGATETSPAVTSAHWRLEKAGSIGNPLPGLELKLVPNGEKQELRVRGVSVFPAYRNAPEATAQAFDDEGYYKIGDAGYLEDDAHPQHGVVFNGRVAEDFKLTTGTWVSVGTLRPTLVAAFAPWAQDAVLTGHDREEVGVLLFPSAAGLELAPEVLAEHLRSAMRLLAAQGLGSSQCPGRLLVMTEPPNADAGEITDKGYLNQGAVLRRRAADVLLLHAEVPGFRVIRP
ncbi:MAG TPA: feruloyl-CoA synthase [Burkholderiaceae bacterium]|nr:feruloyl-CoA synthase [Burkholderiaceae bacterium]